MSTVDTKAKIHIPADIKDSMVMPDKKMIYNSRGARDRSIQLRSFTFGGDKKLAICISRGRIMNQSHQAEVS
jgi:hypothetical protein